MKTENTFTNDPINVVVELSTIANPSESFVIISNGLYEIIRMTASSEPKEAFKTPDGKPSANLIVEIELFECYKIRFQRVFIEGRNTAWWVVMAITDNAKQLNFSADKPERVIIMTTPN